MLLGSGDVEQLFKIGVYYLTGGNFEWALAAAG